jgi:hypothetical protein
MMARRLSVYWRFLRRAENRTLLGWLGGGAATVVAGLWLAVTHYLPATPAQKPPERTSECRQEVDQGIAACQGGVRIDGPVTITR